MPPRTEHPSRLAPERRALQDTIAWPVVIALLVGALIVFFLPRIVPPKFLAVSVGAVFAGVTVSLVLVLAVLIERWLHRHAATIATDAERQVQSVGVAGLPTVEGHGALVPLASAFADAGARAALLTAERESNEMVARLGAGAADALARIATLVHADPAAAISALDDVARAIRLGSAPVPMAVAPVDVVGLVRDVIGSLTPGSVQVTIDTDRAAVMVDRQQMTGHLHDLLGMASSASPDTAPVSVHVSRIFRSNIEETPVRRTGDSRLTIVPRSSGDALRAWVMRAQPGAEVLSLIISDAGAAPSVDEQQRAFDPFALGRPGDPLGVTLATVRRTVTAARGTIWIDGSREGGTAVHIYLPIAAN